MRCRFRCHLGILRAVDDQRRIVGTRDLSLDAEASAHRIWRCTNAAALRAAIDVFGCSFVQLWSGH